MRNIQDKVSDSLEYLAISFLVGLAVMLLSPKSRGSWRIMAGSVLLGWAVGWGAGVVPSLVPFASLLAAIATVSAPATIMKFQNKALDEIINELKDLTKKD